MTSKRNRGRDGRRRDRSAPHLASIPFQTLQNPFAPFEILTADQVEKIHKTSMRILVDVGIEFLRFRNVGHLEIRRSTCGP